LDKGRSEPCLHTLETLAGSFNISSAQLLREF
jgi:hypothetical protein